MHLQPLQVVRDRLTRVPERVPQLKFEVATQGTPAAEAAAQAKGTMSETTRSVRVAVIQSFSTWRRLSLCLFPKELWYSSREPFMSTVNASSCFAPQSKTAFLIANLQNPALLEFYSSLSSAQMEVQYQDKLSNLVDGSSRRKTLLGAPVTTTTECPLLTKCLHTSRTRVAWPSP